MANPDKTVPVKTPKKSGAKTPSSEMMKKYGRNMARVMNQRGSARGR